ncbi:sensor histidine kinase [Paenibacillus macquariensis]|uniref:Two-component system, sensor histidine kinase YesM n=1 Tax=Paenibacillus macquariensis TaxID=948756 RepID=A0ABY1JJD3_9BACL|nr:sensor histidine kinase [Paenibacillus macquariensis]MEC0089704.1 sensor histidine kinase [Paenibacillus macquariensis]OAB30817.1 hypothetical protein PMSM_22025 [Paenibacillus macquariensis subsp. macquariensis]SIQ29201.1 two-component system, sensor histidine kinase YesM [Paenibacillus macquariensis]
MHKKLRMSTILRSFIILVVIVPVILICTFILNIYERDILQQNTGRSLQTSQAVAYSVSQEINRMEGVFASIGVDQDVKLTIFDIHNKIGIERQIANNKLKVLIEKYTAAVSGRVLSVNFLFDNGVTYSYLKNLENEQTMIRQQEWYSETLRTPDITKFLGMIPNAVYGNYSPYMMATAFSPSDTNQKYKLEMILFTFESGAFDPILQSRDNSESVLQIVSEKGEIIASNTITNRGSLIPDKLRAEIGRDDKGSFIDDTDGNKELITYAKVINTSWYIVQIIPYSDLMENYRNVNSIVWILAILIIVSFVLVSFYFISFVTKPIRELVRITEGDLKDRYTISGSLEVVSLGQSFNLMTDQVQELIDQHKKQEVEKRKAEFAALQSQINPHFLINTLNTIKYMALISKADNIRNMTHALTNLLASSFNRGGLLTTIDEEAEHLKHYLYIMEIRFGRPIQMEWDIDRALSNHYLLKLLIQPILENSIIHGLKEVNYPGRIDITIKAEEDLIITIADNGAGMSEDAMTQMDDRTPIYKFSGMGNRNVHRRIQLHYGERYGLEYEPNHPQGTTVRIRLPLIIEPDDEELADKTRETSI